MSPRAKATLVLVVSAPILTEIVSGNTLAHALLDPRIDLFLLVAYSLPVLVIRELALRWRLPAAGVFLLGLAYGIWNEGLLAQTLLRFEHVPINRFDHYLYAAGFNFSWTAVIVPWHALLAVAFPLALVHGLFPSCAQLRWLGDRVFSVLASILIAVIVFISVARRPHVQMLACLLGISLFVSASFLLSGREARGSAPNSNRVYPFGFGAVAYVTWIIGAVLLAAHRVPSSAYFFVVAGSLAALAIVAVHLDFMEIPASSRLALGAYFAAASFNAAVGVAGRSLERILTGAILAVAFLALSFAMLHGESRRDSV